MAFRDSVGPLREQVGQLERRVRNHPPARPVTARIGGCVAALAIPLVLGASTWALSYLPYYAGGRVVAYTLLGLTMFTFVTGPWIADLFPSSRPPSRARWRALLDAQVEAGVEDEEALLRARARDLEAYLESERPRRASAD